MIKLVLLGLGFDLNPAPGLIVGGIAIKVKWYHIFGIIRIWIWYKFYG